MLTVEVSTFQSVVKHVSAFVSTTVSMKFQIHLQDLSFNYLNKVM